MVTINDFEPFTSASYSPTPEDWQEWNLAMEERDRELESYPETEDQWAQEELDTLKDGSASR